jgi:hypothetical protein
MKSPRTPTRRTVTKTLGWLFAGGSASTASIRPLDPEAILPTAAEIDAVVSETTFAPTDSAVADELLRGPWTIVGEPVGRYFWSSGAADTERMTGASVWQLAGASPTDAALLGLFKRVIDGWPERLAGGYPYEHRYTSGDEWVDSETVIEYPGGTYQEIMRLQVSGPFLLTLVAEGMLGEEATPEERVSRHAAEMVSRANAQLQCQQ